MTIGALGCNLAWGIIDAVFYLIACLTERGHNAVLLRSVQNSRDPEAARKVIVDALPPQIAEAWQAEDFDRIRKHLLQLPPPAPRSRLTAENLRGALGVFLLVFFSTLPVVIPFVVFQSASLALRVSNGVAIALLFGAGYMLATYAGLRRVTTGLAMVAIGAAFVALTIALGG
jgi:VIT1/CCC1 family predicted Fe2+/Mn2+ transporter